MLILILGTDAARPAERRKVLSNRSASESVASAVTAEELRSYAESKTLFGESRVYVGTGLFSDEDRAEALLEILPILNASEHTFIFEEESGASLAKQVEKQGGSVIRAKAEKKQQASDPFALANALGRRDRKNLWLLYRKAIDEGASPEQLVGMLAWKARSMLAKEDSKDERKLSQDLLSVYHGARRGEGDMELLLERLILTL